MYKPATFVNCGSFWCDLDVASTDGCLDCLDLLVCVLSAVVSKMQPSRYRKGFSRTDLEGEVPLNGFFS